MMNQVQQMQEQQLERQQQMVRDDPECKAILDQHLELQGRAIAAAQSGNNDEMARIQTESLELQKNPKYMQMMMMPSHTDMMKNVKMGQTKTKQFSRARATKGTTLFTTTSMPMTFNTFSESDMPANVPISTAPPMASSMDNYGFNDIFTNKNMDVASFPEAAAYSVPIEESNTGKTTEERLRKLEGLKTLLTEKEYNEKRSAILADF
eukprot:CAMPEP_0178903548 /NCGR_PEP_ID=MMETSP0786-20121207/5214_1 /TAXON_ID=186022 /ORGANISM="Thalassionema frauenfeldii, Strain CCMP 1798" /LENGTH=207 /DNA_ID=CAMNT_0020574923 /DNA_START=8 /DNA_END=631 /DNA_ORIENTATION=+